MKIFQFGPVRLHQGQSQNLEHKVIFLNRNSETHHQINERFRRSFNFHTLQRFSQVVTWTCLVKKVCKRLKFSKVAKFNKSDSLRTNDFKAPQKFYKEWWWWVIL